MNQRGFKKEMERERNGMGKGRTEYNSCGTQIFSGNLIFTNPPLNSGIKLPAKDQKLPSPT